MGRKSEGEKLKRKIVRSLRTQGFSVRNGTISPPKRLSKKRIRKLHEIAVRYKVRRAKARLANLESALLERIASSNEISLNRISPKLVEVYPDTTEELLFRYASLHWSIPVSSGYGRRLRFLVVDESNDKLIGLIGLGDPVYSLRMRDEWIGWDSAARREHLANVMDAFVLGAVPPYSFLLGGKLVALLATCNTIRKAFERKYNGKRSRIRRKRHDGKLALITTTSALGRSSLYNRLKLDSREVFTRVGFTSGSGEFHFSNGTYDAIFGFAEKYCEPSYRKKAWGMGFRNRREVLKKCLPMIGLSSEWIYHGVEREIFVAPMATNTREFLRGEHSRLLWHQNTESEIFDYFRKRWMLPRAARDLRYLSWSKDQWRIWS